MFNIFRINRQIYLFNKLQFNYHQLVDQVKLTEECVNEIHRKQQNQFKGKFLRLGVEGAQGCSGFKYQFNFDNQIQDDDYILKQDDNILIAIDEITLKFVQGSIIDYEDKMIRSSFYVQDNPNAEKQCSCKVSFAPKPNLL